MKRLTIVVTLITAALVAVAGVASSAMGAKPAGPPVSVQILSVSDWHAQLDPVSVTGVGNVGGAAVLSSYFKADRLANPNTLTLTAGDAYGAAPPLSAFFDERPAVLAMRMMGFDADTFGNHNFDRGIGHLQQMVDLANAPAGAQPGAPFRYLSANLRNLDENLTGVDKFGWFRVGGQKIAVIGATNEEAPTVVKPGSFGTIEITDAAEAINKRAEVARQAGADAVVVITHKGVRGFTGGQPVGELIDLAWQVRGVDVIVGDHTDVQYTGVINGVRVVEARSKGVSYARTNLTITPGVGVTSTSTSFVTPVASAVTPDPAIESMLQPFRAELAAKFDRPIARTTGVFVRGSNIERLQEVALGNLVTDAMRLTYGTQLAITNGGGLRSPLPSSYVVTTVPGLRRSGCAPATPCDIVLGDVFSVLPFGNVVVTRTVTGAQLHAALEHSVGSIPGANGKFAQISGFRFTYDAARPAGSRLVSVTLNDGTPILANSTTYTVATNDFMNTGGDGYTMLSDGTGVTRDVMFDVAAAYIEGLGLLTPTTEGRITRLN